MIRILAAVILALASATALAQQPARKHEGRQMSQEDRERMRQDMREAYRQRQDRPGQQQQKMRQMSPEERAKMRRDIEAANKDLRR